MRSRQRGRSTRTGTITRHAAALLIALGAVASPGGPAAAQGQAAAPRAKLEGAGATFPAPLYKKWIGAYTATHADTLIDYKDVGSGEGVRRFLAKTVDFGASDGALTDEQIASVDRGARLIPMTAGMVVLAYNLPGLGGALKLSREVYADIFLRRITQWNDPRIQKINPQLSLPRKSIEVVARLDGSGTTFALSNHLSAVSPAWRAARGTEYLIDIPQAMRARGNEGVAATIKRSEGAIGYVEYGFALRLGLPMAQLQNKAGVFVAPSDRAGGAALANNAKQMPENLRLFIPDPDGADSYPIVSLSWLLLYGEYPDASKAFALKEFVRWSLSSGQTYSADLGYVALPSEVAALSRAALDQVR